jgi:hypothetical protein
MSRLHAAAALLLLGAGSARAGDLAGSYSALRVDGQTVSGAALQAALPVSASFRMAGELSAQFGAVNGEDLTEWALVAGPAWSPRPNSRLQPFLEVQAGLVRSRRQVDVFGVALDADGVCTGGCPASTAWAAELGGGLDVALGRGVALRALRADYRLTGLDEAPSHRLRVSAGLVWRWGR